ncbi:hypothetical protein [Moritella viscosa]|nr:hypothetical protein [Moritella viscosa]SHO07663.1 Putative uncharacterized protein [Moritella viscosa]SHO11801.1 Putative uncharacterized protein [Moritella viscosa]
MLRVMTYLCLFIITGCAQQHHLIIMNSPYSLNASKQYTPKRTLSSLSSISELHKVQNTPIIPEKYANFSGVVTITANQRTIRLCHNDAIFNLQPNNHLLAQIKRLNQSNAYIEFEGQINQSLQSHHQRAEITIEQLHYLSNQNNNTCRMTTSAPNFEVIGTEQNWVGYGQDNIFRFVIKDLNSKWSINKSVITKGLKAFVETQDSDGKQLNISFTGNGCIDNNNNYWQYETKLLINKKQIKGCGKYPNHQENTQAWIGNYHYKNSNVTIELELAEYHQANVKYHYRNGTTQHSRGYWHFYGSSGLKLLLTQHQGKKANVVYHFRRDGVRLQASQQWRDNTKYSFNGAILTLDRMDDKIESFTTIGLIPRVRHFQSKTIPSPTVSTSAINKAVKRYFAMHKTKTDKSKYWFSEYDLNGNGNKDLLVMIDWCKKDGCVLLVFENKLNRYKFVSRIAQVQAPIQISKTQQHQWQSLLIKKNQNWQQLDFDGISYPAKVTNGKPAKIDQFTQILLMTNSLTADNSIYIK